MKGSTTSGYTDLEPFAYQLLGSESELLTEFSNCVTKTIIDHRKAQADGVTVAIPSTGTSETATTFDDPPVNALDPELEGNYN